MGISPVASPPNPTPAIQTLAPAGTGAIATPTKAAPVVKAAGGDNDGDTDGSGGGGRINVVA
jgi:hypothetical protein